MNKIQIQNFQKKIQLDILTGCWNWAGSIAHGYGYFSFNDKTTRAHRVSYEHWNGKIPEGLELDHLCRNRKCVNPQHLEAVTKLENMQRSPIHNYNKIHCPQGHEYSIVNTVVRKEGWRVCRTCKNLASKKQRLLKRERGG